MKQTKKKNDKQLTEQATSVAAEIFSLINQYTHDSITSKFFLPEDVSASFYVAAGGFASVIYTPQLEAEQIRNTYALTFLLVLITYGFQIYLKERSIRTNAAPYRLPTDSAHIEKASLLVLEKAEEGNLLSSPLTDEIINITLKQLQRTTTPDEFKLEKHILNDKKLYSYMVISLYYGYNMAALLINEPGAIKKKTESS